MNKYNPLHTYGQGGIQPYDLWSYFGLSHDQNINRKKLLKMAKNELLGIDKGDTERYNKVLEYIEKLEKELNNDKEKK